MDLHLIAFDADDTLFVTEPYFQQSEQTFCDLLADYLPKHELEKELFRLEMQNLDRYGYGIKGFILSMIETAYEVSNHTISASTIAKIVDLGKEMLQQPIELIDGVEDTLQPLHERYKLIVATKGDLKDQQRKLHDSGLGHYFHHIEVMADKQVLNYQKLLKRLEVTPQNFMMIGNSLKSDVIPVLEMGGYGVHVPFHVTWEHEKISHQVVHPNFTAIEQLHDLLTFIP
jgi:putative hydrolase of the HAD superfamily